MTNHRGSGDQAYAHLMTIPQAKITARESFPPVTLFTMVVEYRPN